MTPAQAVEAALQMLLDSYGDGWTLSAYVVCLGLEKIDADGITSASWVYTAPNQPEWITNGLILESGGILAAAGDD